MKKLFFVFALIFASSIAYTQTLDELKAEQAIKKDSVTAIQKRVDALQGQIDGFKGWKIGAFGTIGGNLSGYNNWYAKKTANSDAGNLGFTVNGYANLDKEKYFWKNSTNINLSWVKLDDKDIETDETGFQASNDVFTLSSLYGYKLSDKFAVSALGEYRSTIINNFNDPGYLDIGIGATWTPLPELVVVVHPLNYNFVFSSGDTVFESSFGTKIVADYTKSFGEVNFKSNLSIFQSYKSSNYSNWTWTNTLGYTLWKGIGIGLEGGLRKNKQEALNYALTGPNPNPGATFDNVDNELQTYWLIGLNYNFK